MGNPQTIAALRRARALLRTPEQWLQREYAEDAYGEAVSPLAGSAARFCMLGALGRATHTDPVRSGKFPSTYNAGIDYLQAVLPPSHGVVAVASFNDASETEFLDVLDAFDKAIALAEKANG